MVRRSAMTARTVGIGLLLVGGLGLGGMVVIAPTPGSQGARQDPSARAVGIHKIRHVVIIMQENRSFDSYFGTYPGADGIPVKNGVPKVCNPDPKTGQCIKPYHDRADLNGGGPHFSADARADINGGKMDGFVRRAAEGRRGCLNTTNPACTNSTTPDVMGYHDERDIPNYWAYARNFVLQDHMFSPRSRGACPPTSTWSRPGPRAAGDGVSP